MGGALDSVPGTGSPFPNLPGWASEGESVPSPAGPRCPKVGWFPKEAPFSKVKKRGNGGLKAWDCE